VILFLDFDGVLHPISDKERDFSRLPKLWEILRSCPHVNVVLSTSWREIYTPAELFQFVTNGGGEDLLDRFIGINPLVLREAGSFYTGTYFRRERECQLWLAGNGHQHRFWLALDDVADSFSPSCANLYLINEHTGLTDEDVLAIVERIN
jgi:hypothetical protein